MGVGLSLGRRIRRALRALVGCELGIPFEVLPLTSRETLCKSVFAFGLGFHICKMKLHEDLTLSDVCDLERDLCAVEAARGKA